MTLRTRAAIESGIFPEESVRGTGKGVVLLEEKKIHLIVNPAANHGKSGKKLKAARDFLDKRGSSAEWRETTAPGDAERMTGEIPSEEVVIAVGGDGTVHEVAAACAGTERIMGILPTGSGNDYVKALGIRPEFDHALDVIVGENVRVVDTGVVNGTAFNNGLGIGFDAEVAEGVKVAPTFLGGTGRYIYSVMQLLWNFECHDARLTLDDGKVIEAETILVAAAIGTTYGARFRLAPQAKLDDGLFDIVWSDEVDRKDVMRILPSAFGDGLHKHEEVNLARSKTLKVELEEAVPAHVDGEKLPVTTVFEAEVRPNSLHILAP